MTDQPSRTHLVLIPSYNPGALVQATVQAARAQWSPVWVVIDGSTDASVALLRDMASRDPGLRLIERKTPKHLQLHLIVDNYATHKHSDVQQWLAKHPRFVMHFTPTGASWLNMVERFFRDISENRIKRDSFTSVAELEQAIAQYIEHHNNNPKPIIWIAGASDILAKVTRAKAALARVGR